MQLRRNTAIIVYIHVDSRIAKYALNWEDIEIVFGSRDPISGNGFWQNHPNFQ